MTLIAISRAPTEKLQAYKKRMGWRFPYVSLFGSDFNFDFDFAFTEEQMATGELATSASCSSAGFGLDDRFGAGRTGGSRFD